MIDRENCIMKSVVEDIEHCNSDYLINVSHSPAVLSHKWHQHERDKEWHLQLATFMMKLKRKAKVASSVILSRRS